MRTLRACVITALVVAGVGICTDASAHYAAHHPGSLSTVRRVSRRTSRRTTARVARRRMYSMPASCTTVVVTGTTYYVNGGIYYVKQIEAGKVVYMETQVQN